MTARRERISDIFWSIVAIAIVGGGGVGFVLLGLWREPLVAADIDRRVSVVETRELARFETPIPVRGEGFVRPFREVSLAAQSGGRVVELHPALLALGEVAEGEVLVRLDARSASAALTRATADLDATRARLALNATQLARAEKLRQQRVISEDELDQRLSEKAQLTAELSSLESARTGATIALENTDVRAPFDARVRSRSVQLGSVVGVGQALAEIFTEDALEVTVPLSEAAAALIPDLFSDGRANARVITEFANVQTARSGAVVRVASALNAETRMLDVTVAIEPESTTETRPPVLVDSYAEVIVDGASRDDIFAIPAAALRVDDSVWLVADEVFDIRPAEPLHIDRDTAFVRIDEAPAGARLVVGIVDAPVDGMPVTERDTTDERPSAQGSSAAPGAAIGAE